MLGSLYNPKDRYEVVLLSLGFRPPAENEVNPNMTWFNGIFHGIEVSIEDGKWTCTGASPSYIQQGCEPETLPEGIANQFLNLMSILTDEELGIK